MKRQFILILLLALFCHKNAISQAAKENYAHQLSGYMDNDFLNPAENSTDDGYSSGIKLSFYYTMNRRPKLCIDRWMPKAGPGSENVFGIGIMHVIYTPSDLNSFLYQANDYNYAGAVFAQHSLYSSNPKKKYSIQTQLVVGVLGPDAKAKELQIFFHDISSINVPNGWDNQFRNDLLLNINLSTEKELLEYNGHFEVIVHGLLQAGTMYNGATVSTLFRIGKMTPYFDGYLSRYSCNNSGKQHKNSWQIYFTIQPEASYVLSNALIEGSLFNHKRDVLVYQGLALVNKEIVFKKYYQEVTAPEINNLVAAISYGFTFVNGPYSLSYTLINNSAELKGIYNHTYGNVTFYYNW